MNAPWDVVVIGAGPAGASAAYAAASAGARTLLLDKARFPRSKVCGGCLNTAAITMLSEHGVVDSAPIPGTSAYSNLRLSCRGRSADIAISPGVVVERAEFDNWLVTRAQRVGATFHDATSASIEPEADDGPRAIAISHAGVQSRVVASVLVVATGLAAGAELPAWRVARRSKIGLHAIVPGRVETSSIEMAVGRAGYVGAAQLPGDRLDIAAAVRPESLRAAGSAAELLNSIREEAGLPLIAELHTARITGTSPLTRRRGRVAGYRMLLVGDAAGYVEPFTGEGIAWALASGFSAGRLAAAHVHDPVGMDRRWSWEHHMLIGRRQRVCGLVRAAIGRPRLVSAAIAVTRADAEFAAWLASFASRPYPEGAGR